MIFASIFAVYHINSRKGHLFVEQPDLCDFMYYKI